MISGSCHGVNEVFALLGCYVMFIGSYWHFGAAYFFCPMTLEGGTDVLFQNVIN